MLSVSLGCAGPIAPVNAAGVNPSATGTAQGSGALLGFSFLPAGDESSGHCNEQLEVTHKCNNSPQKW